jgi:hypothetical protein
MKLTSSIVNAANKVRAVEAIEMRGQEHCMSLTSEQLNGPSRRYLKILCIIELQREDGLVREEVELVFSLKSRQI